MSVRKVYRAIGLMSGTSLDGVDAALIETDGADFVRPLAFVTVPYPEEIRAKIRGCFGVADRADRQVLEAERLLTVEHIKAVQSLAQEADIIGFHGQTIHHDPANKITVQIGDAAQLAKETGIDVVADFRSADMRAGGQGAPLLPLYHRARVMAEGLSLPVAVLNIGGVANVTWIGKDGDILAFDTGPGNALIDDWVKEKTGADFDADGMIAAAGMIDREILEALLSGDFFRQKPPKSLDRNAWNVGALKRLRVEDGAATLTAFTVEAIRRAEMFFPQAPQQWLVAGGGRNNLFLMESLRAALGVPVSAVEHAGWNGDAMEAEGFAYLAVRSFLGEPLSLPTTTGVPKPMTGGVLFKA